MENFQEATSRQVKLLTSRLNEALSSGLELLHSELGVDLGLKPELLPPWVIPLAACVGLVLLVALWASACRCLFKRRPAATAAAISGESDGVKPSGKAEDQKKKKKKSEKKGQAAQPNGRAVPEQEEAMVSEEIVPHHQSPPPEVKTEKASEKSKKKGKQVTKDTKKVSADGKEPEEGTWEMKVSNKEKREQRKKEKTPSDGSASPGGGGSAPTGAPQELPKPTTAQAPAGQKKKKGESTKVKVEKVEAVASQVGSSEPASSSPKAAVKAPAHTAAQAPGRWAAKQEPATLWGSEIDGSWTVIESGMKTSDQNQVSSFSGLSTAEPVPELPKVEDEWSGQSGDKVDTSSDWNAPSELWSNVEEPAPVPPAAQQMAQPEPAKVNLLMEAADDDEDDDKDKGDAGDGAGKTKKRKKKKRKVAEEGGHGSQDSEEPEKEVVPDAPVKKQQQQQQQPPAQEKLPAVQPAKTASAAAVTRAERPAKEPATHKAPVAQVPQKPSDPEPTAKQNQPPAPQKKLEESQAPKPAKKKKARRET
ncbi:hypothetical protein NHX12_000748 [Muraenolepis orangiensis]|uniref:LYRIC protein n=1 Tax=Muraenolepis orangiensis TaxID=630683 RepID=A0A9Q0IFZ5_9TELE|nr:hypothetical protein NHX12_000748 [Muraenolepis orangiensis]